MKAAEQKEPLAQYFAGLMYYKGFGTKENISKAVKWLVKSQKQGNKEAEILLALITPDKIYKLTQEEDYKTGNCKDYSRILNSLGWAYLKGINVKVNFNKAAKLFKRSSELGLKRAKNNLMLCLFFTDIFEIKKNYRKIFMWLKETMTNNEKLRYGPEDLFINHSI